MLSLIILSIILIFLVYLYIHDKIQIKHSLLRNYPISGHGRWIAEWLRPKFIQYFIESDTDGKPIPRNVRSLVYQRAKGDPDTVPFGTQHDLYKQGAEWVVHNHRSNAHPIEPFVNVGSSLCGQPYKSSIMNSSAMSYGALGKNAILAIGKGALTDNFAQNTGEGGISDYHLENNNDLIWQVGTGYFGARDFAGYFSDEKFKENALRPQVKMIELKLSQGAKPGTHAHLPAIKNTEEIAKIRGVKPFIDIFSNSKHSAFNTPQEMMLFINKLRLLSNGKPIGIKLCVGDPAEVVSMINVMANMRIYPDFITVDGAEGGTGAAPMEFTNNVGMPLIDALAFVDNQLRNNDLRNEIKIFASGKIFSGFDVIKALCIGADGVNSARGMMLALGCIQALECHNGKCPTGITTNNPKYMNGLVVEDKYKRVANYHNKTIKALTEIMDAMGIQYTSDLNRSMLYKRCNDDSIKNYSKIYPYDWTL